MQQQQVKYADSIYKGGLHYCSKDAIAGKYTKVKQQDGKPSSDLYENGWSESSNMDALSYQHQGTRLKALQIHKNSFIRQKRRYNKKEFEPYEICM